MNRRLILKLLGLSSGAAMVDVHALPVASVTPLHPGPLFNQVGYLPSASKVASVQVTDSTPGEFRLFSGLDLQPVLRGPLSAPVMDEASGDRVAFADFSSRTMPGMYQIAVGETRSASFMISKDAYRDPLRLAMRSYYGQRCGCAVDLGNGYRHPACHSAGAFHPSSGKDGILANYGGWHDAGDYGRYVVNSGLSTGTLLWAWELYPDALRSLSLSIPESGGKVPDYLAEIRWNLNWMLSLQDKDGGVWHKQTSEQFCGFIMPQYDSMVSYVIGIGDVPYKSTCATGDLAAVMAIAARVYAGVDAEFAAVCLASARKAWSWATAHPNVPFANPKGIDTGGYDDKHCGDEILWASSELWRTTGEDEYERAFLDGAAKLPPESELWVPSWPGVAPMAYWSYLLADRKPSAGIKARIMERTASAASTLVSRYQTSGYGNTLGALDYTWGSNAVAANQSLLLLIANHFQPDAKFREAALGNLHYLLGRNCFGVSWITQVGTNPFQHPHHRPSIADGITAPWPGLLSGGPNAAPADDTARTLPKQPPMRMWMDDERAYSMNEVAINWNAPLVFILAAANSLA